MPEIIALDPGPKESAYVVWDGEKVLWANEFENNELADRLRHWGETKHTTLFMPQDYPVLVIEWISGFGIPAGSDIFETCRWVGRFQEAYRGVSKLVTRKKVKEHLQAVNDKFVRQALIARFGEPGTKKAPGTLYGVTGHRVAALAVAVTYFDLYLS